MSEIKQGATKRCRGRQLFWGIALIAGALLLSSFLAGYGRHWRHRGEHSPEELLARMEKAPEWVLSKVDATDEQRASIKAILDEATPELLQFQKERQALRAQFVQALAADQVSPDDLAQIRTAGLRLAERAVDRGIDLTLQLTEVLTPEQRKELAESWRAWR